MSYGRMWICCICPNNVDQVRGRLSVKGFVVSNWVYSYAMQCNVMTIKLMIVASVYYDGDRDVNIDDVTNKKII